MDDKDVKVQENSTNIKETAFYKGLIESAPPPQCEAWVQSAGYESRKQKRELTLRALFVRAYSRENGRAHLFFYQNEDGMEPDFILDLDALKSVKRHFTKKKAPEQAVTYLLKFRSGHRIRTRFRRVKVVDHVMRFEAECAPDWDKVLLNKGKRTTEQRRHRLAMKTKLKSILHTSTFHRFHRKKKASAVRDLADAEKIKNHLIQEEQTLGLVTYDQDALLASVLSCSEISFDMDRVNVDENCVARQPTSTNAPKLASMRDNMRDSPTKELDSFAAEDVDTKIKAKRARGFTFAIDEFDKEGVEDEADIIEVQFESGAESDPNNSQTSCSSGEIESEIIMLDSYSISPKVEAKPVDGPPFTSFARLLNTSQETRFSTWPTKDEFQILLEFERLMDSGEVDAENGWENKLDTKNIRIYTKKLPATVSSATLVSAQFLQINAPPEIVYALIHNRAERLKWDDNIKTIETMEGPDKDGRDIEYCVCKAPMGFSNREFLKYRICDAEYQKYPYIMLMRSCERDEWPVGRGNVRAESVINGYVIRPEKDDPWKTRISIAANTEIKGLIPTWTVNAMAARLPPRWVSALEAAAVKYIADNKITRATNLALLMK